MESGGLAAGEPTLASPSQARSHNFLSPILLGQAPLNLLKLIPGAPALQPHTRDPPGLSPLLDGS